MPHTSKPQLKANARADVGEGPLLASDGSLLWVDILGRKLFRYDPATETNETLVTHPSQNIAFVLEDSTGTPIVGLEKTVHLLQGTDLSPEPVVTVIEPSRRMAMNDATIDPNGNLWVGIYEENRAKGEGELWRIAPGGESRLTVSGLTLPNGIAFSPDGKEMYVADSFTHTILAFRVDPDTGELTNRRTIWHNETAGFPDGLCTDLDGNIWVAFWGGSDVKALRPDGSEVGRIELPVTQVSSCAFGPGGDLYITSARAFIEEPDLEEQPLAGGLFAATVRAQGVPVGKFGGSN